MACSGRTSEHKLKKFNSLWVGDRLGYLEVLCLKSALAMGHEFALYSYTPHTLSVPEGVEVRDAAEIMPEDKLLRYADTGSVALGANLWRYELMAKDLGYWVDMDLIFLKPFDFPGDYVFGWEHENWINNAVLLAPAESGMTKSLRMLPRDNQRPPWFGPRRSLTYYWRRLTTGKGMKMGTIKVAEMPWGTYSAGLVTYVAKKQGVSAHAQPPSVFYPVRWKDATTLYGPAEHIQAQITNDTRAVHMWNSRLTSLFDKPPPEGSYIAEACRKFGVEPSEHLSSMSC